MTDREEDRTKQYAALSSMRGSRLKSSNIMIKVCLYEWAV